MNSDWQAIANLAAAGGVIVAIGALIWQIKTSVKEERFRRSEFALKKTIDAWKEAYRLLKDGNNRRETWIAAARTIELSKKIEIEIKNLAHRDVMEIQRDRYRRKLGDVLGWQNPDITGSFFYGVPLGETDIEIDKAARSSTLSRGPNRNIPENALFSIWQFAEYPDDYEDLLDSVRFSDEDLKKKPMRTKWPGLTDYLRHRYSAGKK